MGAEGFRTHIVIKGKRKELKMINYDKCMSADEIYSVIGELSEGSMSELKQLGFVQGMNQKELIELFDKTKRFLKIPTPLRRNERQGGKVRSGLKRFFENDLTRE